MKDKTPMRPRIPGLSWSRKPVLLGAPKRRWRWDQLLRRPDPRPNPNPTCTPYPGQTRSEEHTSELQSRQYLVCRLLLAKKNHFSVAPYLYEDFLRVVTLTTLAADSPTLCSPRPVPVPVSSPLSGALESC